MLQRLSIFMVSLFVAAFVNAQSVEAPADGAPTAAYCFTKAPYGIIDLIPENTRLDMVDYFDAGSDHHSTNDVNSDCYITAMTDEAISFVASDGVDYCLFLLNRDSGKPLIGIIQTVATPVPDSRLRIYDSKWLRMPSLQLAAPTLSDWLTTEGTKRRAEVEEALPFVMARYTYDPATATLTITNNMSEYFAEVDTPAALSLVKPSLTYRWNGKNFIKQR